MPFDWLTREQKIFVNYYDVGGGGRGEGEGGRREGEGEGRGGEGRGHSTSAFYSVKLCIGYTFV